MANIYRNITIHELAEILGEQSTSCKTCSGKTLLVHKPSLERRRGYIRTKETPQDAIRKATTYANFARRQEVYINKARDQGVTAYSFAIADWFGAPRVLLINVDAWTGKPGQTIRVKARDNIRVASVSIVIRDAQDNVLETGEAVQSRDGNAWWKYTTKTRLNMSPFPRLEATARDLAGNQTTFILC